jgi:hypothetical protein
MLMRTPPHWDAPLSRVLTPRGAQLSTLREAGQFLSERFSSVIHDASLERAIELLMAAAESGVLADRKTATDQVQVAVVLRDRGLL